MARLSKKDRRIRKGDDVLVITGAYRGREGKVLAVDREKRRVTVEGVNRVWKHLRKSQDNPQGGRIQREAPIHISNVRRIVRKRDAAQGE
jgi:large subunit ribosomal protein L24